MKVEIRKTKLSDAVAIRDILNDREVMKQLVGYPYPCPLNRIKKDIAKGLKDWENRKAYPFTILADGEITGQIMLEHPNADKGRYDLGFFVGRKYWGRGIATEAIKQIVIFGFRKLKIYRIQADHDSDNPASGKAMKKAGFKFEGSRKKIGKNKGKFVDLELWGITN